MQKNSLTEPSVQKEIHWSVGNGQLDLVMDFLDYSLSRDLQAQRERIPMATFLHNDEAIPAQAVKVHSSAGQWLRSAELNILRKKTTNVPKYILRVYKSFLIHRKQDKELSVLKARLNIKNSSIKRASIRDLTALFSNSYRRGLLKQALQEYKSVQLLYEQTMTAQKFHYQLSSIKVALRNMNKRLINTFKI